MRSTRGLYQLLAGALLLGACASKSTELVNYWKDPSVAPRRFNRVLADSSARMSACGEPPRSSWCGRIGSHAVPAYKVFPDSLLQDKDQAKAWVNQQGFDGAVILR